MQRKQAVVENRSSIRCTEVLCAECVDRRGDTDSRKAAPRCTVLVLVNVVSTAEEGGGDERGLEQPKLDRLRRELECDRGRHTRDASEDTRSAAVHLVHLRVAVCERRGSEFGPGGGGWWWGVDGVAATGRCEPDRGEVGGGG